MHLLAKGTPGLPEREPDFDDWGGIQQWGHIGAPAYLLALKSIFDCKSHQCYGVCVSDAMRHTYALDLAFPGVRSPSGTVPHEHT